MIVEAFMDEICKHAVTSKDGTSYCNLAESSVQRLEQQNRELMAVNEKLVEGLRFYADGKHIMSESEPAPCNVCPPIGYHAKQTLKEMGVE
jgi:hypothetical protein